MARKLPLLLDHVFFLLSRQDTTIQLTAVRRIACQSKRRVTLHSVYTQHFGLYGLGLFNRIKDPAKNRLFSPNRSKGVTYVREGKHPAVMGLDRLMKCRCVFQRNQNRPDIISQLACWSLDVQHFTLKVEGNKHPRLQLSTCMGLCGSSETILKLEDTFLWYHTSSREVKRPS